jgi:nucleoid DNA-binding protein
MTKYPPTTHQRTAAAAPKVAATPSRPVVTAHATAAPKRDHPRALLGKIALIARVAERSGKSVQETSTLVNATLETIREALKGGDEVRLTGFGSFGVRTRAAHTGVNPQTRAKIRVPAKAHVRFSAGKDLSDAVAR